MPRIDSRSSASCQVRTHAAQQKEVAYSINSSASAISVGSDEDIVVRIKADGRRVLRPDEPVPAKPVL